MLLTLFLLFLGLSFLLIVIGFWKTEHTELALMGFFFIFLLGFPLMNSTLQLQTGQTESYSYTNDSLISERITVYDYTEFGNESIGRWMIISSFISFIIVIVNLKRTNWRSSNQ